MPVEQQEVVRKEDLERLALQLQSLSLDFKQQSIADAHKPQAPKTWWETAIQFLGLPVVVLGLVLTFSQIRREQAVPTLTSAEARKADADANKANAEAAKLNLELAELQRKQALGRNVELAEIDRLIPRLRTELQQSMQQQQQNQRSGLPLVLKYVILSIAWMSIGLITTPFGLLWSSLVNVTSQLLFSSQERSTPEEKPDEDHDRYRARRDQHRSRWRRIHRVWHLATLFLHPVPAVLDWSLRFLLFVAVAVPLFDQTAAYFGSPTHFADVAERLLSFDLSGAIAKIRDFIAR
jgi:hypothetical protein